ncbi:hypothetical protein [Rhodopirellula sp. P2]|uniref:hypothetical protein n=1 Tax=Rhodopirellula sp. P2 TaxID=2127060 RepID=UPI002368F067|nr:hypothetical protein [Rhodopirellula sp. P2]WDQ17873.1 hypothetical protein PSR62_04795 [Rhodopirellula sp. P2]
MSDSSKVCVANHCEPVPIRAGQYGLRLLSCLATGFLFGWYFGAVRSIAMSASDNSNASPASFVTLDQTPATDLGFVFPGEQVVRTMAVGHPQDHVLKEITSSCECVAASLKSQGDQRYIEITVVNEPEAERTVPLATQLSLTFDTPSGELREKHLIEFIALAASEAGQ